MEAKKLKVQTLIDELLHPVETDLFAGEEGGGGCCRQCVG